MFKRILIVIVVLIVTGCAFPGLYDTDNPCDGMSRYEIGEWVVNNIEYIDYDSHEFKSPREILRDRSGVCRDFASIYMWLIYLNHGDKYILDMVWVGDQPTVGGTKHALVIINGEWFEPQQNRIIDRSIYGPRHGAYDFDNWFKNVTDFGTKEIERPSN